MNRSYVVMAISAKLDDIINGMEFQSKEILGGITYGSTF